MLISINGLSDLTRKDRRFISRRLERLPFTQNGRAKEYESADALALVYGGADGERLDGAQERALLDKARRESIQMDNEKKRGDLLPYADVAAAWTEQIGIAKGRFLTLPSRLAPRIVRTKAIREVELILRDGIIEVMSELAGGTNEA